jgi:hypothetical protein
MNYELERVSKEAVVAYLRYCPGIRLDRLRKTTKPTYPAYLIPFDLICIVTFGDEYKL